jgi:hypothetical protein
VDCAQLDNKTELSSNPMEAIPSLLFGVINLDFVTVDSEFIWQIPFGTDD